MPTAILPIMVTVAIGFAIEGYRSMDVRALTTLTIYVLLPALIFSSLLSTQLTLAEALPLAGVTLSLSLILWLLGKLICRLRGWDSHDEAFHLLTTIFMNAGNVGMPVALYAFGEHGLDLAVIWVLAINAVTNTVAIYYASRHLGGHSQAVRTIFRLPVLYAAAAAILLRLLQVSLPVSVFDPIQILGRAVIPISQLVLGIQLAKSRAEAREHLSGVILPVSTRLVLSPLIALGLATLFGLHGLQFKIAILMAGMPTAINIAVYATEFGAQPRRVATAVFASTLASFATVSGLLILLGAEGAPG